MSPHRGRPRATHFSLTGNAELKRENLLDAIESYSNAQEVAKVVRIESQPPFPQGEGSIL